jgi:hypothetical protein
MEVFMKQVLLTLSLLALVAVGCNRNQRDANERGVNPGMQQEESVPTDQSSRPGAQPSDMQNEEVYPSEQSRPSDMQREEDYKQMGSGTQTEE